MILDTNALSAFAEGEQAVVALATRARVLALPVVVLAEYRFGIAQSRRRQHHESWLSAMQPDCLVLEINDETASYYAGIRLELKRAGTPLPVNDTWIAALSRQHNLAVLTRDKHFDALKGIERITW